MKIFYLTLLTLLIGSALPAQQEDQYTQFMHYKFGFNPGAAGSEETTVISALVRSQWLGLEGAPQSQLLTFNMPLFNQKVGIGANLIRHSIGLSENYELNGTYAYRIDLGRGVLGIGLQASVRLLRTDFSEAQATQPIETDAAIPAGIQSKYVPNFGAGLFYRDVDERFYIGFSIPRFLQNNIDLADSEGIITREIRHYYLMGGAKLPLSDQIDLLPHVLLKYVVGAPFDADINVSARFADKFSSGISYRIGGSKSNSLGEALAFLVGMDFSENFMFGLSYDLTLSDLQSYNNGSVEGLLRYRFGGKSEGDKRKPVDGRGFFD